MMQERNLQSKLLHINTRQQCIACSGLIRVHFCMSLKLCKGLYDTLSLQPPLSARQ